MYITRNQAYGASTRSSGLPIRSLFPPVMPANIPAFAGGEKRNPKLYKIFFKKSAANYINTINSQYSSEFKSAHITIRRVDNNQIATDVSKYPLGMILAKVSPVALDKLDGSNIEENTIYKVYGDDSRSPYCLVLRGTGDSYPILDTLYKIQMRLSELELTKGQYTYTSEEMNKINTGNYPVNNSGFRVSEWSTITVIKPITEPNFGLLFGDEEEGKDKEIHTISTANFEYVGYYQSSANTVDEDGNISSNISSSFEKAKSYRFRLYDASRVLLSDSGDINVIEHDTSFYTYSFNFLTRDDHTYFVTFEVTSVNGYVGLKEYKVISDFRTLQMSNAMVQISNERDLARMKIEVRAKQAVLVPAENYATGEVGKIGFVLDEGNPQYTGYDDDEIKHVTSTQAMIQGPSETNDGFFFSTASGVWVMETKVMGLTSYPNREEALLNPYINIMNNDYNSLGTIKVICYKEVIPNYELDINEEVDCLEAIQEIHASGRLLTQSKKIYPRELNVYDPNLSIAFLENMEELLNKKAIEYNNGRFPPNGGAPLPEEVLARLKRELQTLSDVLSSSFLGGRRWSPVKGESSLVLKELPAYDYQPIIKFDKKDSVTYDAQKVTTAKSRIILQNTPHRDFVSNQEYYIFLAKAHGGLTFYIFDGDYDVKGQPGKPMKLYQTSNEELLNFVQTKKIEEKE